MNLAPREEYIPLTPHQLQILLALALRPLHGYGLTEQVRQDSSGILQVGRGSVYRAIMGMERLDLIVQLDILPVSPGRQARLYAITDIGRQVLDWEIERARMIVHLGYERLGKPKKELDGSFFRGFSSENEN